jgi:hypothetical protein
VIATSFVVCASVRFSGLPVEMLMGKPQGLHIHAVESRCKPIARRSDRSAAEDVLGRGVERAGKKCGEDHRRERDEGEEVAPA